MSETWGATPIEIEPLYPSGTDRLIFSKPFINNIRIMSSDHLTLMFQPPYYGDTVNLKFWELLGIDIGTLSGTAPLTRIDGYRYEYNHSTGVFSAYDDTDVLFVQIGNIKSIGDMNIDFTILNSHQFEIIVDASLLNDEHFIFPAKWLKEPNPTDIEEPLSNGVNNIYFQDRIRPYKSADYDNPTSDIKHIGAYHKIILRDGYDTVLYNKIDTPKISATSYAFDINWWKQIPNNDFVRDGLDIDALKLQEQLLRAVKEDIDWILPILSTNIYPMLLPILRPGEVHINRPVYEPWLVMGIPTRESIVDYDDPFNPDNFDPDDPVPHPPIITDDPEDERFTIPVFDLSPMFS